MRLKTRISPAEYSDKAAPNIFRRQPMSWFSIQRERRELVKELCDALEKGTAPWQKPWSEIVSDWPRNAVTGHKYGGTNAMRLYSRAGKLGYDDPRWMTYRQAQDLGGYVLPGAKGIHIQFLVDDVPVPKLRRDGSPFLDAHGRQVIERKTIMKSYVVFNASQVSGIPPYEVMEHEPVKECEKAERILSESGAVIHHGGNEAFYNVTKDYIGLPPARNFRTSADYYATALHELTHWTGHVSRLKRDFTRGSYAFEELVAEIGSMFVSMETGIDQTKEHFDEHAAYVGTWIKRIKEDSQALFKAVRLAHDAAEYILKYEREREKEQDKAS